jgi:hypothetical protein
MSDPTDLQRGGVGAASAVGDAAASGFFIGA